MKKILVLVAMSLSVVSFNASADSRIETGKALVAKSSPNCASCHGADFNTPINPGAPKLAGQHKDYLEHALIAYRRSAGSSNSRNDGVMGPIAKDLSDQDIKNIAAYLHSLPGSLVLRK
jgi:cytochrome c553